MCGIVGHIGPLDAPVDLDAALRAIRHRGPDDIGRWSAQAHDVEIHLGHQRLSIFDLSPDGHQPMVLTARGSAEGSAEGRADDELVIVHNGEVYNYLEIREELKQKGRRFRTGTDTEVILAAWREWGEACVERFVGMWAFALWDGRSLFLCRDRLGQKPLYIHHDREARTFAFASEIGSLHALGVRPAADEETVFRYLAFAEMEGHGRTFFAGISELPPATMLRYDPQSAVAEQTSYWHLPESPRDVSEAEAVRRTGELLIDSIDLRLRSDAPLGLSLSGGLDSTLLLALTEEHGAVDLPVYSTSYREPGYNENQYLDIAVKHLSCSPHQAPSTVEDFREDFELFLRRLGQPSRLAGPFSQWRVARCAADRTQGTGVKVLLDGQGADELAAGYVYFLPTAWRESSKLDLLLRSPDIAATLFANRHVLAQYPLARILERLRGRPSARPSSRPELPLHPAWQDRFAEYGPAWAKSGDLHAVLRRSLSETSLPALLRYGDRVNMAWGIENRSPFLDHRLVDWVAGLPAHHKLRGGTTKWIFRKVAEGRVPPQIIRRRVKMGFPTPFGAWLRGPLATWADEQLDTLDTQPLRTWLDLDALRQTLAEHRAGEQDHQALLWRVFSLGMWARTSHLS